ncbi:hypothetical protein GGR52DRAFT_568101 [Hypoxylon sp. FL1284]|nr:hypothetical protein GGR52DRAFT_568101 [Hypoxylon sp. FL1284]
MSGSDASPRYAPSVMTTDTDNQFGNQHRRILSDDLRKAYSGDALAGLLDIDDADEAYDGNLSDIAFAMYETDWNTWAGNFEPQEIREETSITLLNSYPRDWSAPELSGHLLKESLALQKPTGYRGTERPCIRPLLKLIPRPETAYMTLSEFWDSEVFDDNILDEKTDVITRHGVRRMNLLSITNWIMGVDEQNLVHHEQAPEPVEQDLEHLREILMGREQGL